MIARHSRVTKQDREKATKAETMGEIQNKEKHTRKHKQMRFVEYRIEQKEKKKRNTADTQRGQQRLGVRLEEA